MVRGGDFAPGGDGTDGVDGLVLENRVPVLHAIRIARVINPRDDFKHAADFGPGTEGVRVRFDDAGKGMRGVGGSVVVV